MVRIPPGRSLADLQTQEVQNNSILTAQSVFLAQFLVEVAPRPESVHSKDLPVDAKVGSHAGERAQPESPESRRIP